MFSRVAAQAPHHGRAVTAFDGACGTSAVDMAAGASNCSLSCSFLCAIVDTVPIGLV